MADPHVQAAERAAAPSLSSSSAAIAAGAAGATTDHAEEGSSPRERWLDRDWRNLLNDIHAGNVIVVVGPELLTIEIEGRDVPLYEHVCQLVVRNLELPQRHPAPRSLHDIVCMVLDPDTPGPMPTPEDVLCELCAVMRDLRLAPPRGLLALAKVRGLKLFVTNTPDTLLEEAINLVRFDGRKGVDSLAFTLQGERVEDLPDAYEGLESPAVFHPFGRLSTLPNRCVVTDEDLLEFFYALQHAALPRLLDALRGHKLLFLGGTFPDWLTRFFFRTVRKPRLSEKKVRDYVVGNQAMSDPNLVRFLRIFAKETRFPAADPVAFAEELARRWVEQHPPPAAPAYIPPLAHIPEDAIFLSYASEDRAAVEKIKAGLEEAGLTVWFDKTQLMAGDDWDRKIQDNLDHCGLFVPVVSRNTEAQPRDRYFRNEWYSAVERLRRNDASVVFMVPVRLDPGPHHLVPPEFAEKQWTTLPDGTVDSVFRDRMVALIAQHIQHRASGA